MEDQTKIIKFNNKNYVVSDSEVVKGDLVLLNGVTVTKCMGTLKKRITKHLTDWQKESTMKKLIKYENKILDC